MTEEHEQHIDRSASMTKARLGRLEQVELRSIWISESADFTPWLAEDENIARLGEAIGMDLELEGKERAVGPFKADVLCKDSMTGNWVLIENQLERTDHTHLGQLLTYAAGLEVVTIVWLAQKFTEEHRAALDWLNRITHDQFSFFGIEIELLRIGSSDLAPNFRVISKPNDWQRKVSEANTNMNLTEIEKFRMDYWGKLAEYISSRSKILACRKPQPNHWFSFGIGSTDAHLSARVNTKERKVQVALTLSPANAKALFAYLKNSEQDIESKIGARLDWRELPDNKRSYVELSHSCEPTDRSDWLVQHQWLFERLESFHKNFSPLVRSFRVESQTY